MADARIKWEWDYDAALGDEFRLYRSDAPMDKDDLPAPIATGIDIGDREFIDDDGIVEGETYYCRVSVIIGAHEVVSEELEMVAEEGPDFAVWDTDEAHSLIVLTNGDRTAHRSGSGITVSSPYATVRANIGHNTGKRYFEISSPLDAVIRNADESGGIVLSSIDVTTGSVYVGYPSGSCGYCYRRGGGAAFAVQENRNGTAAWVTTGSGRANDGYMGMAVDLDNGLAWCIINGVWAFGANPVSAPGGRFTFTGGSTMFPAITIQTGVLSEAEATHTLNAGQDPFLNVSASDFDTGGVLAGFEPGWLG